MIWRLAAAYPDYLLQLSALLRDPVYHGHNIPKGHGHAVLLIPGFLTGDWMLMIMAGWLNRMGYRTYFSGIHWNVDCPNRTAEVLGWRLDHITQETGHPITIIGHSLGGMLARFLGVNFPQQINHVVALGSPLDGSLRVNPLVPLTFCTLQNFRSQRESLSPSCGSHQCTCQFAQTVGAALSETVTLTSVYSKEDEIVDWRASVDPQGTNIQVSGHHLGLTVNREVYRAIAATLAEQAPITRQPSPLAHPCNLGESCQSTCH
ncbi:MAG: esterase/lipase family protein [Candidatus Binatia bacterium]